MRFAGGAKHRQGDVFKRLLDAAAGRGARPGPVPAAGKLRPTKKFVGDLRRIVAAGLVIELLNYLGG